MSSGARAATLIVAMAVSSCAGDPRPLTLRPDPTIRPEDYEDVLERWTRKAEIYDVIQPIAYIRATLHSPEMRKAFLQRFPDVYGPGSEEARRLTLADPSAETKWAFFLSASTVKQSYNDFQRPDSIWRVTLRADDGPVVDAQVRAIPLNANLRVFYPYLTPFASGYGLEFPLTVDGEPLIGPETRRLVLRLSSAIGETELVWELGPPS